MTFNPLQHHRRSIRLRGYDYSQPGAYFMTLCVKDRECLFGEIFDGIMRLNEYGKIVREKWHWLAGQYQYVELDEFIIMPNHFHGILWIRDDTCRGGSRPAPTTTMMMGDTPSGFVHSTQMKTNNRKNDGNNFVKIKPVGQIIGAFKTVSAKQINIVRNTQAVSVWQRDFYERIGRDDYELNRIRQYIRSNPANWNSDNVTPRKNTPWYVALLNPQRHYTPPHPRC